MDNFLILRAGPNFRLGSGISVEEEVLIFDSLCGFLKGHGLLAPGINLPSGHWDGFELRANHLTAEGLSVVKCGLDRWLTAQDKGRPASDVTILEKCLIKVRKIASST